MGWFGNSDFSITDDSSEERDGGNARICGRRRGEKINVLFGGILAREGGHLPNERNGRRRRFILITKAKILATLKLKAGQILARGRSRLQSGLFAAFAVGTTSMKARLLS